MAEWSLITVERGNSQDRCASRKNVTSSWEFRVQLPLIKKLENLENRPPQLPPKRAWPYHDFAWTWICSLDMCRGNTFFFFKMPGLSHIVTAALGAIWFQIRTRSNSYCEIQPLLYLNRHPMINDMFVFIHVYVWRLDANPSSHSSSTARFVLWDIGSLTGLEFMK